MNVLITSVLSQTPRSPWSPQPCAFYQYQCGDVCVSRATRCLCGEVDWNWFDDQTEQYCCVPPGGSRCYEDSQDQPQHTSRVLYHGGELLPWNQSCHGDQCEGSPRDFSLCPNDCLGWNNTGTNGQTEPYVEFNLTSCIDNRGSPGLYGTGTESLCRPNYRWCTEDMDRCINTPGRELQMLRRLCQNSTFWESQDCNDYNKDGNVIRYGERCRGRQQHCYYPAYLHYKPGYTNTYGYLPQCNDKSDQIFERLSHCNMSRHLDIHCEKCNSNNKLSVD